MATGAQVLIPEDLVEAIDATVGAEHLAAFVVEAARDALARRDQDALLERFIGSLADVETPGWETEEAAAAWVRAQRRPVAPDPWDDAPAPAR
jgi:hypothetical protein